MCKERNEINIKDGNVEKKKGINVKDGKKVRNKYKKMERWKERNKHEKMER